MNKINNSKKSPEIRFPGFTDDWEERKLGELANIVGGGTPSTSNPEYWDGDIDWYAPAEIGEEVYVSKSKKTISELGQKKSSARILPVGTVLFTSRAGIGNTAILAKEATTNQGFQSIVPDKNILDSYFIFSRTNELKRYGEVTGAGSTFVEVSGKQMSKMPIMVPELLEQQKIGSFFKQLDDSIALHQRKLDLLKEQKKGFLQKMFPKNGEKVPEIRFPEFPDDWEQRKLGEIGDIITGNTPKTSNPLYYNGTFLFVSPADIQENRYIKRTNLTLTETGFNTGRLVRKGSTLFVSIGSTIGKVAQASTDVITNQQINSVISYSCNDDNFIYTSLVNISKKIKLLAATQAIPIINKTEFSKNIIYAPDLKEQQKIGSFFKQLDDTIALHQRKLELLKEMKKAFLQKMFV